MGRVGRELRDPQGQRRHMKSFSSDLRRKFKDQQRAEALRVNARQHEQKFSRALSEVDETSAILDR